MPGPSSRRYVELSMFTLDEFRYGVPLAQTQEFVRAVAVSPLPNSPAVIEGVINLRGRVIPVINLRTRFQLPLRPPSHNDYFMIANSAERSVALRVETAFGLVSVSSDQIDGLNSISSRTEYLEGIARLPDGLLYIHDLDAMLADAESRQLDAAMKVLADQQ